MNTARVYTSRNRLDLSDAQATSHKPQATSRKPQAASRKPQAASRKPQAASRKPQAASAASRGAERFPHRLATAALRRVSRLALLFLVAVPAAGVLAGPPQVTSFQANCVAPCLDPATIRLGATVRATAPATLAKVEFFRAGEPVPLASFASSAPNYHWTHVPPGSYELAVVVTDSLGQQARADAPAITVRHTPRIRVISPSTGSTVAKGVPTPLSAVVSDPDGIGIDNVVFKNAAGSWIGGASAPSNGAYTASYSFPSLGAASVTAIAYNRLGTNASSATAHLQVAAAAAPPPAPGPLAYLSNAGGKTLSVIDTGADALRATVPTGPVPKGLAVSPDARRVYVALSGANSLAVYDAETLTVLDTLALPYRPLGVAVSPNGTRVYVSADAADHLLVIDTVSLSLTARVPVGTEPQGVAVSRDGARIFVATGAGVSVIDAATFAHTVWPLPPGSQAAAVAVKRDGSRVYVGGRGSNAVYVLDGASGQVLQTLAVGTQPAGLALDPKETALYVANFTGSGAGSIARVDLASGAFTPTALPAGAYPLGLGVHPEGSRVYAASHSNGTVYVLDTATGAINKTLNVGSNPYALGIGLPQANLVLVQPAAGALLNQATPALQFTYQTRCQGLPCQLAANYDPGYRLLGLINGAAFEGSAGAGQARWQTVSPLPEGLNQFSAWLTDRYGATSNTVSASFTIDTIAPRFTTISPPSGSVLFRPNTNLTGSVDEANATITLGGATPQVGPNFNFPLTLNSGLNTQSLVATDPAANSSTAVVNLTYAAFALTLSAPEDHATVSTATVTVRGSFGNATSASVTVNGIAASITGQEFSVQVPLALGLNTLTITATRADDGQVQTQTRQVHRTSGNQAPTLSLSPSQNIVLPSVATLQATANDDGLPGPLSYAWVQESGPAAAWIARRNEASTTAHFVQAGVYVFRVTVSDGEISATATTEVRVTEPPLPPDPATIAPPIDPTLPAVPGITARFLYTGANPIQTGVNPDTIDAKRAAVMRGKLLTRDNQPLSGATVTIHGHPEFGQTRSRADGMFDLVVNGGGTLTLNFEKPGYLPAQRQLQVPWQDFAIAPEVVLIPLDNKVTPITLSSNVPQLARGGVVSDERGTRSATVFFPAGTTAAMVLPDGSQVPLDTLHFRATEYTVGPNGPQAMPGELPPASAYTYAAELSADEAFYAGARSVQFSQPVAVYVGNFIGFPVGGPVPVGWYDRERPAWIPTTDGRVIALLGVQNGKAELDVDGSGSAATPQLLIEVGIDSNELTRIAEHFAIGDSFWRFQTDHFSPFDCNWPHDVPPDAEPPKEPPPSDEDPKEDCDDCPGSIVTVQNRVLGERVAVLGTAYTLNYRSDRVPGRGKGLSIQLSGDRVPASLKQIVLTLEIAGKQLVHHFPPQPNQRYYFEWDGLDAFGRQPYGGQYLDVLVEYVYPSFFCWPRFYRRPTVSAGSAVPTDIRGDKAIFSRFVSSFREFCVEPIIPYLWTVDAALGKYSGASFEKTRPIPHLDSRPLGFGGWSLDAHKVFDPVARSLRDGDGITRGISDPKNRAVVRTHAGTGDHLSSIADDGRLAREAAATPSAVAVAADGTVYFVDAFTDTVRSVDPHGILRTVAGKPRSSGGEDAKAPSAEPVGAASGGKRARKATLKNEEGVPATQVDLKPTALAVGGDGVLYIADRGTHSVRRVGGDGSIRTIAGNGLQGFSGDGGPATEASLNGDYLRSLAVTRDGSLLILDYRRVRRVGTDGNIVTIVGSGEEPATGDYGEPGVDNGDGGPAALAGLSLAASAIGVGPDDDIYIADWQRVRRVNAFGRIRTVAGKWGYQEPGSGDGGPAVDATLLASSLAVARDGTLFIGDSSAKTLRRVTPDGRISALAHSSQGWGPFVEGATGAKQSLQPSCIAVGPEGVLYVADDAHHRLVRVEPALPGFNAGDFDVSSKDGTELYRFDGMGRHTETLNARIGTVLQSFSYTNGLLTGIQDGDGNSTRIERDAVGNPLAIVAPDGQRTTLSLDQNGWLASIVNPAGETHRMAYTASGLLTRFESPRGQASTMSYDASGRLIKDENAAGGFWSLAETAESNGRVVALSSAEGRARTYRIENLPTGDERRTNTAADGTVSIAEIGIDGVTRSTAADGTVTTVTKGPDPRFGLQSPINTETRVALPSGLTSVTQTSVTANLADANNPLSLIDETTTRSINGRSFSSVFDAAARRFTNTSAAGRVSTLSVDVQGRPTRSEIPGIAPVNYSYDPRGRLTTITQGEGPQARQLTLAYGSDGFVQSITDALTRQVIYQRDAAGRVTQAALPGARTLNLAYDPNGNVTGITPPGRLEHGFQYTPVDRQAEYQPPAAGLPLSKTQYTYNRDQQLTATQRPDGSAVNLSYDTASRLQSITPSPGSGDAIRYAYQSTTGLLASIETAGLNLAFVHDGKLKKQETLTGPVAGSIAFTHDENFRITGISVNGQNVPLAHDPDGLLTQAGELTLTRDSASGLVTGTSLANLTTTQGYNPFGELASFQASHNASPLLHYTLSYDPLGRITAKDETVGGVATAFQYQYDPAGRLEEVRRDGSTTTRYGYDANGNRVSLDGSPIATYDDQDRLLTYGGTTYSYTANGTLTQKTEGSQITQYAYDAFGNLRSVTLPDSTQIDYLIDGKNRRVGKKVNGVLTQGWLYQDQLKIAAEFDGSGTLVSRFVYGTKVDVPEYMHKGGKTYRLITDHLGSVRMVVDATSGEIAQRIDYDEFGQVLSDTHPGFQPFGFAGGLYDPQTKLVRFGARDYDAQTGRWTAKDPIGFRGGDSNLFGYVASTPLNEKDPRGLASYTCVRPLKGHPGPDRKNGPDVWGNPSWHQYSCVDDYDPRGVGFVCGGQGPKTDSKLNFFHGPGKPTDPNKDYFHPDACEKTQDDNKCFEDCMKKKWAEPRPDYGWPGPGSDCKDYDNDVNSSCQTECSLK